MGRLSGFDYKSIVSKLRKLGFEFDRHARGSHEIWWNPTTRKRTTIPNHPGDLPEGTLRAVLKQAGISVSDFLELVIMGSLKIMDIFSCPELRQTHAFAALFA